MAGREFDLPEPLIRLIQSFLTTKEAAQTTLLSRSWLSSWLTRPNLVFDVRDFCRTHHDFYSKAESVLDYAEETIRRYEMLNLNIQSLSIDNLESNSAYHGRVKILIFGALKLGATRLSVRIFPDFYNFKFPNEVFASESLVSLVLAGVIVDLGPNPIVGFSMLRSLRLEHVRIQSRDMLIRMISSCPLIEELELIFIMWVGDDAFGGDGLIELRRLRSLVLDRTDSYPLFLNGLSVKFPSLENLTLRMFIGEAAKEEILISSPSIKRLVFKIKRGLGGLWGDSTEIQRVKFDLPSICKLTFEGAGNDLDRNNGPGSMKWESDDVSVTHHHKCLTANTMDFLGGTLLQGLHMRFSNLRQLMYGSNDLKEARAQILDKDASMWRDVPLLDDTAIPEDNPYVGFQLIWQPKQKKLN